MANDILPVQMAPVNRDNLAEPFSTGELPVSPIRSTNIILPNYGGTQPSGVQFDRFTRGMPFGTDPIEWQAQQQSSGDRIANGLFRLVTTTGTKFLEGIGYAGGMLPALASGDMDLVFDNAFSTALNSLEEGIKEAAPIKHNRKYLDGNILQQMGTLGFWMDDVVDGAAFLVSNLIGAKGVSAAMKSLGVYNKLGRAMSTATKAATLGKAAGMTGKSMKWMVNEMDLLTMSIYNSGIEASFEGADTKERVLEALRDKIKSGEITLEEANRRASTAARNTYVSNVFALMPSNYITNSMFFRSFKGMKSNLRRAKELRKAGKIDDFKKFTRKDAFAAFGKEASKSMLAEGPYEENIQLAIQNLEEGIAVGDIEDRDKLIRLAGEWVSNYFTDEGHKAIALGMIIGLIPGGVGGVRSAKAQRTAVGEADKLLKNTMTRYSDGTKHLFKRKVVTDEAGESVFSDELELDENGMPIPDYEKVAGEFIRAMEASNDTLGLIEAAEGNNQVMFDYIKDKHFADWAKPFLMEDGGLEFAKDEVDVFAQQEMEALQQAGENVNIQEEVKQMASQYKQKLNRLQKIWNNIEVVTGTMKLGRDKASVAIKEHIKDEQFKEAAKQIFFVDKTREIEAEIADLETGPEANQPQTVEVVKDLKRQLSQVNAVVVDSEKTLANWFDEKKQRSEWEEAKEEYLKTQEENRANAAAVAAEAEQRRLRDEAKLEGIEIDVGETYTIKDAETGEDKSIEITSVSEDVVKAQEVDEDGDFVGEEFELSSEEAEKLKTTKPLVPEGTPEPIGRDETYDEEDPDTGQPVKKTLLSEREVAASEARERGLRNLNDALTTMHFKEGQKKPEVRNEEFDAYSSDPANSLEGATVGFHIDFVAEKKEVWDQLTDEEREKFSRTDLTSEEADELLALVDEEKYSNLVDIIPIGATINDQGQTWSKGIYYHRTDYANLYVPKAVKDEGKTTEYYEEKQLATRRTRFDILKRILTGQEVSFTVLKKTEGYPNNVPGTENEVIETLGIIADAPNMGITDRTGNAWTDTTGSSKLLGDYVPGLVLIETEKTASGNPFRALLNPSKLSDEHAGILFDAFGRKHEYGSGGNRATMGEAYAAVDNLTAGEIIELLVVQGRAKTSLLHPNNAGKYHLTNKQLYVVQEEGNFILYYGTESLNLSDVENRAANRQKFIDWAIANKNYAVNKKLKQQGVELNWRFQKTFKLGSWEVKQDKDGKFPVYSTFLMRSKAITTDLVLVNERSVFSGPVIVMDVPQAEDMLSKAKPAVDKPTPKPDKPVPPKVTDAVEKGKQLVNLPVGAQIYMQKKGRKVPLVEIVQDKQGQDKFKALEESLAAEVDGMSSSSPTFAGKIFMFAQGKGAEVFIDYSATPQRDEVYRVSQKQEPELVKGKYFINDRGEKFEEGEVVEYQGRTGEWQTMILSIPEGWGPALQTLDKKGQAASSKTELNERMRKVGPVKEQPAEKLKAFNEPTIDQAPTEKTKLTIEEVQKKLDAKRERDNPLNRVNQYGYSKKYPVQNLQKELQWFFNRFSGVPVELTEKLIKIVEGSNSTSFGQLRWDSILLFDEAEVGTIYHEAFHRVTQMYFTEEERTKLYKAAKQQYKAELKDKSDRQIEEILAEKFRLYVFNEGEVKGIVGKVKKAFQWLYDLIYNFFVGPRRVNKADINGLFKSLQRGRWRYSKASQENIKRMKAERLPYVSKVVKEKTFHTIDTTKQLRKVVKGLTNLFLNLSLGEDGVASSVDFNSIKNLRVKEGFDKLLVELEQRRDVYYSVDQKSKEEPEKLNDLKRWGDLHAELVVNFDVVKKLIEDKLLEYNVRKKTTVTFEGHEEEEFDMDSALERYSYESFERDPKENILGSIKALIASLPESEQTDDFSDMYQYVDFSKQWDILMHDLHDAIDVEDMIQRLKDKSHGNVSYQALVKRLERGSENLRTQFYVSLRKHRHEFMNILFMRRKRTGGIDWEFTDADIERAQKIMVSQWNDTFVFTPGHVRTDEDGKIELYQEYLDEVFEEYRRLKASVIKDMRTGSLTNYDAYKESLVNILNKLSIMVDVATIDEYIKDSGEEPHNALADLIADKFIKMFDEQKGIFKGKSKEPIEKMFSDESLIRDLANYYVAVHPEEINNSVPGAAGAIYYTYGPGSFVTEIINTLKKRPDYITDLLGTVYARRSRFLRLLLADPDTMANFKVRTFAGLIEKRAGDQGRKYPDITRFEDYTTKLNLILKGKIPFPSMADRGTYYVYEGMPIMKFRYIINEDKTKSIPDEIIDQFMDYARDEWDRIKQTESEINFALEHGFEDQLVNNYHHKDGNYAQANGLRFQHFPEWNAGLNIKFDKRANKVSVGENTFDFDRDARPDIVTILTDRIETEIRKAEDIGVVRRLKGELKNRFIDVTAINDLEKEYQSEPIAIESILAEYTINTMMAVIETEKIFSHDPAFYQSDNRNNVTDDKIKRLGVLTSTGDLLRLNHPEFARNKYVSATFKTQHIQSKVYTQLLEKHVELLKVLLENEGRSVTEIRDEAKHNLRGYKKDQDNKGMDISDAQVYISPAMYREIAIRLGEWTPEVQEAFDLLQSDKVLTPQQEMTSLNVVMKPLKLVYFGPTFEEGKAVPIYDKMSLATLFRRMVKDKEIEDLLDRMEDEREPIDMIKFDSAVKVGIRDTKEFYNEDGTIADLTDMPLKDQDFQFLFRQLITDPHDIERTKTGTQFLKVTLGNLNLEGNVYELDGVKVNGQTIANTAYSSLASLSNKGIKRVLAMFGVTPGTTKVDEEKLLAMLQADAVKAGMPDSIVDSLRMELKEKYLELDAFPDRQWIYSRILAAVGKETVDIKLPGNQFIQQSNFGFKVKSQENLGFKIDENGNIQEMEARVSINLFKHMIPDYESLTWAEKKAFVKNNLSILGYRIPTQGQNSIAALRIVELLPEQSGDTIILPDEFTTLTGSDFDIDKLFVVRHNYRKTKEGSIERVPFLGEDVSVDLRYETAVESALYSNLKALDTEDFLKLKKTGYDIHKNLENRTDFVAEEGARINDIREQLRVAYEEEDWGLIPVLELEIADFYEKYGTFTDFADREKANRTEFIEEARRILVSKGIIPSPKEFLDMSIMDQNSKEAVENKLIDTFFSVLNSEEHFASSSTPLGTRTGELKGLAREVRRAEGVDRTLTNLESASPTFQVNAKMKYIMGKFGIGPFALANTHHVFAQIAKLKLKGRTPAPLLVDENGNIDLSQHRGRDGVLITDWLSALIDAHVDVAKDPYVIDLNVNAATYNVSTLMVRAGAGEIAFRFLSQPILKEYAEHFLRNRGRLGRLDFDIFNSIRERYKSAIPDGKATDVDIWDEATLMKQIKNPTPEFQLSVLNQFEQLNDLGSSLFEATQASQIDTKRYGKNFSEVRAFIHLLEKVIKDDKFINFDKIVRYSPSSKDVDHQEGDTFLGEMLNNSALFALEVMSDQVMEATDGFYDMHKMILDKLGLSFTRNARVINEVSNQIYTFLAARYFIDPKGFNMTQGKLKNLLFGDRSILAEIHQIKHGVGLAEKFPELKDNVLMKYLNYSYVQDEHFPTFLTIPSVRNQDKFAKDTLTLAWAELFEHTAPEVQTFAKDLMVFAYYTSGFKRGIFSFYHFIPPEHIRELRHDDRIISYNQFIKQTLNDLQGQKQDFWQDASEQIIKNTWWVDTFVARVREDSEVTRILDKDEKTILLAKIQDRSLHIGLNKLKQHIYKPYVLLPSDGYGGFQLMEYIGYDKTDNFPIYNAVSRASYYNAGVLVKEIGFTSSLFDNNKLEKMLTNPHDSARKHYPGFLSVETGDATAVEVGKSYDETMVDLAKEDVEDVVVEEPKVDNEIRVPKEPELRTGEIVKGEDVDVEGITRTKEIIEELNRTDLTEEERQVLTDEMEGLYYGEPEERISFKKPPEDLAIHKQEAEYTNLFRILYTDIKQLEDAFKQIPGFSRKYHKGRIWVLKDENGSNNYGKAVKAANRINKTNPGLISIRLDPIATEEAGRQVWYPAINQKVLDKQLKDINDKVSEANEDILPPLNKMSKQQQVISYEKLQTFLNVLTEEPLGGVNRTLEHIKKDIQDPGVLKVIEMLQGKPESNKKFWAYVVGQEEVNFGDRWLMAVDGNVIFINDDKLENHSYDYIIRSFVHEVLHMYTAEAIDNPQSVEDRAFANEIDKLFKIAKKNTKYFVIDKKTKKKTHSHSYSHPAEFIADVLTNKKLIADLKQQKYNIFQRIWYAIVDFFRGKRDIDHEFKEEGARVVFDFVEQHATFRPISRVLQSPTEEGRTFKEREDDFAEDEDLKNYMEKANIVSPLQELAKKAIKAIEAKRKALKRGGKSVEAAKRQDVLIQRLYRFKGSLRGAVEFVNESHKMIETEFVAYKKRESQEKEGTFEFRIKDLTRMREAIEAFDVLDEYLKMFQKDKGLIPPTERWQNLYTVLQDSINKKNIIKAAYEFRGLDLMVDWLEPHFTGIYRTFQRDAQKKWRALSRAGKTAQTEEEYVAKQTKGAEVSLKERTRNLLKRELKLANKDISVLTRWVDNMLDTRDPIAAAFVERITLLDSESREASLHISDVVTDALRKLESSFPQRATTDLKDYYSFMLEVIDKKQTQHYVAPWLSSMWDSWFAVVDETAELPIEKREAARRDWKDKNAPMDSKKFREAKLDYAETLIDEGMITEKEYDRFLVAEGQYWKNGIIHKLIEDQVNNGNLPPEAGEAIASWVQQNAWNYRVPARIWRNPQWLKLVKIAGGDVESSVPDQRLQVKENKTKDARIEFYNLVVRLNEEANANIPFEFRLNNKLPGIEKDFTERVKEGQKLSVIFKATYDRLFNVRPDEVERGNAEMTDSQGNTKYFLPIHFTSKVEPENQSYDLPTLYHRFWAMANEYALKQEVLPQMEMTKFFINERETVQRDSSGKSRKKWFGPLRDYISKPKGKSLIADQFNDWMLMAVYGKKIKDEGAMSLSKSKLTKPEEKREYDALLSKKGRKEPMTVEEEKRYEELNKKSAVIEMDYAKLADLINSYTALNLLGLNFTQGTANIILGEILQAAEVVAGEYIDLKSYTKANRVYHEHLPYMLGDIGLRRPRNKVSLLIELFDILHEYEGVTFRKSSRFRQLMTTNTLFFMQHSGEHWMQGRFLLAFLENKRAFDKDGNDIGSILDNYITKNGKLALKDEVDIEKSNWTDEERRLFGIRVRGVLSRLHGEYSDLGRIALQRMALGRMAYMFRKFMVPGFKRRYQKAGHTQRLDDVVEGNYRTFGRFFKQFMKDLFSLQFHLIGENWAMLTKHERANIHRTIVELNFLTAAIIMANIALRLRGETDDDKEKQYWSFAAYQMLRLRAELLFFSPKLDETISILRSPMASMSVLENVTKLMGNMFDPITSGTFEFERYERGPWKGKPKISRRLVQMTPGFKQMYRMREIGDQVSWFMN